MPFIKPKCPTCYKDMKTKREFVIAGKMVILLECGHIVQKDKIVHSEKKLVSIDGKEPFQYQLDGMNFLDDAAGKALIGDEQGLGKTVQALGFVARNEDAIPFLCITKSAIDVQWARETLRWIETFNHPVLDKPFPALPQIIKSSKDVWMPGCIGYVISYDLVARIKDVQEITQKLGIKTLILDECQQIKNHESKRCQASRRIARKTKYLIALSGTPIKNNAGEFFPILNMLKPERFNNYADYIRRYVNQQVSSSGSLKLGGLRNPEYFRELTKSFILRRERADVMPDIPPITRRSQFRELGAEVEKAYVETLKQFQEEYDGEAVNKFDNILKYMNIMRRLTGLSKVPNVVEYVAEFLESTDRKIVVFVHHKDVMSLMEYQINTEINATDDTKVLCLTAESNKQEIVDKFLENNDHRVMLASTLVAGEGLNLQKYSDAIMAERQWNPANEEQAEGRFARIGQEANKITVDYFVAVGTIDEFFAELVEKKRQIVKEALNGEVSQTWDEASIMVELADKLANIGGKKWGF